MTQEQHEGHRPYADEGELQASLNAIRDQIAASDRRTTEQIASNRDLSKEQLDRIEAQTSKTNGRVSRLEAWRYAVMAVVSLLIVEVGWLIAAGVIK